MLNRSWAPTPLKGFETSPSTEGPIRAPAATSTTIWEPCDGRYELRDQPGTQYEAEVAEDVLYRLHPLADQGYKLLRQRPQLKCSTQFRRTTSSHRRLSSSGSFR